MINEEEQKVQFSQIKPGKMAKTRSGKSKRWSLAQQAVPFFSSGANGPYIEHHATQPLLREARVGFSILNLTGHPIRYLQHWDYRRKQTIEYLEDNERGLLNFIASNTVIRDNHIVEESFEDLKNSKMNSTSTLSGAGHQVALQIAGFKWLRGVQADALGITFEDITSITGVINVQQVYKNDWKIQNALKLVAKVKPYNGGRMLQLSSVFAVKNRTSHPIKIMANDKGVLSSDSEANEEPFIVPAGKSFHVPISLLHKNLKAKRSLGYLWLAPAELRPIIDELGISSHMITSTSYTVDPINLMHTVEKTSEILSKVIAESPDNISGNVIHDEMLQLSCILHSNRMKNNNANSNNYVDFPDMTEDIENQRIVNFDELPPFCYNIEIETNSFINQDNLGESGGSGTNKGSKTFFGDANKKDTLNLVQHSPLLYTIGKFLFIF
jgi:hypothetical protein